MEWVHAQRGKKRRKGSSIKRGWLVSSTCGYTFSCPHLGLSRSFPQCLTPAIIYYNFPPHDKIKSEVSLDSVEELQKHKYILSKSRQDLSQNFTWKVHIPDLGRWVKGRRRNVTVGFRITKCELENKLCIIKVLKSTVIVIAPPPLPHWKGSNTFLLLVRRGGSAQKGWKWA